jgi:uncharacterized cupredoxin-like copper-binding protein
MAMSWRQSGGFRPSTSPPRESRPEGGGEPPLLDPALQALIVASLVVGLVGLGLMAAFGGMLGQGGQTAAQPAQPAARPTAAPVATAAPAAAAQPTAAPAAGGAAEIPTEPYGPALASGSGTAVTIGTDAVQLIFDQDEITVPNGLVTLTFQNLAQAVQHNWVLVDGDDTVAEVVNDAAQDLSRATRSAEGAVPPPDTPGLLASSPMLNPGDEVTFTFQPPGPGTYEFICTFPGHYLAGMRGVLVVEP